MIRIDNGHFELKTLGLYGFSIGSKLEISYRFQWLRDVCEDDSRAAAKFGKAVAKALRARLSDINAASTVMQLVVGKPFPVGNQDFKVELADGFRLVFSSNHKTTRNSTNPIDWATITRIKIIGIEKIHD